MKRLVLLSTFLISFCSLALADELYEVKYNIIPLPKEVKLTGTNSFQSFVIKEGMGISYDASNAECTRIAQFLQEWTKEATTSSRRPGLNLLLTPDDKNAQIKLRLVSPATPKGKKKSKTPVVLTEQEKESYTM